MERIIEKTMKTDYKFKQINKRNKAIQEYNGRNRSNVALNHFVAKNMSLKSTWILKRALIDSKIKYLWQNYFMGRNL